MAKGMTITDQVKMGRHFFGPVGSCIYCGADGRTIPLSSEHMLAFALGGKAELEEASCSCCAKITQRIERYCASKIFGDFLVFHGIQTRNLQDRKNIIKIEFEYDDGFKEIEVPIEIAISGLILPNMYPPRLLDDTSERAMYNAQSLVAIFPGDFEERIKKMQPEDAKSFRYYINFNYEAFTRFLAKTALSTAVALLNYPFEKSPLRKIVREGGEDDIAQYIGGYSIGRATEVNIKYNKESIKSERVDLQFQLASNERDSILLCDICIFCEHGCQIYQVVIGPVDDGFDLTPRQPRTTRLPRKARKNPSRGL